ncbi:hypothetical protein Trco_001912 [Trichoderma cornu-damae]|uniref:Secreted protein n=1 Tax=Trichoderma cornu-damae TaxID=654480 RepID=A0A9P8QNV6_9HYPO|nr:hypothetical protein Trco_001912 [Trichoderma cornu-damae]
MLDMALAMLFGALGGGVKLLAVAVAAAEAAAAAADVAVEDQLKLGEDDAGWKPDCVGCKGWLNWVELGVMTSNRLRSGVTVRNEGGWLWSVLGCLPGGLVGGCVDQEKDGVWGVAVEDRLTVAAAAFGASSQLGVLAAAEEEPPPFLPLTSASKSSSLPPLVASKAVPVKPPKAIKSSLAAAADPLTDPESSWSFLVCSSSTLRDRVLMRSIKDWNCLRLSSGPRLMFHRIGRMSMATNSASAACPTTYMRSRAAIMTAGSFVLMPLTRGTIFSCMVYLSRALDDEVFLFPPRPLRPPSSALDSLEPPQRTTKAWRPRTLMARLFVRLKTVATTGNSSFFIVLKSRTGSTTEKLLRATSTIEGVGHSMAAMITGSTSGRHFASVPGCGQASSGWGGRERGYSGYSPSLNSLPLLLSAMTDMFSKKTIKPASRAASFSWLCLALSTNTVFKAGRTLSLNTLRAAGSRVSILKTFCRIGDRRSLSFISSSNAGSSFFSRTDLGKDGKTLLRPRKNCDFSFGVFAGKVSRNRIVETRTLSKYSLCWNSLAVMRCAGLRVMSFGSTWLDRSLGSGLEER